MSLAVSGSSRLWPPPLPSPKGCNSWNKLFGTCGPRCDLVWSLQDWGLEFNMALLLVAAFYSTNLFSLIYLTIIAVGMAAPVQARCLTWRFCVLPLLAIVLMEQYSLYIGLPPPWDTSQSGVLGRHKSEAHQRSVRVGLTASHCLVLGSCKIQQGLSLASQSPLGEMLLRDALQEMLFKRY